MNELKSKADALPRRANAVARIAGLAVLRGDVSSEHSFLHYLEGASMDLGGRPIRPFCVRARRHVAIAEHRRSIVRELQANIRDRL